jgi:hypothetical protein
MFRTLFLSISIIGVFSLNAESTQPKEIQAVKQDVKDCQTERNGAFKVLVATMRAFEKHHFILSTLPAMASIAIPAVFKKPLHEPFPIAFSVYATSVIGSRYLLPTILAELNIKK